MLVVEYLESRYRLLIAIFYGSFQRQRLRIVSVGVLKTLHITINKPKWCIYRVKFRLKLGLINQMRVWFHNESNLFFNFLNILRQLINLRLNFFKISFYAFLIGQSIGLSSLSRLTFRFFQQVRPWFSQAF